MLTGKQRSYLKKLTHELSPMVFIGKDGLTENVIKEIDTNLSIRELVKIKLQEGCDLSPKDIANQVADQLKAEFVQSIGKKFTLYRPAKDKEKRKIELPK